MNLLLKNGSVFRKGVFIKADILISDDGRIVSIEPFIKEDISKGSQIVLNCFDLDILPGFTDVHVHLREPGFSYKETISSGTRAAARGGYTTVCAMPNLSPVPDSYENIKQELELIKRDAVIDVIPYASITKGELGKELSDMEELAPYVAGFSDDGKGVADAELMESAMNRAKKLGKLISAHCEDITLVNGGYINAGKYAEEHSHKGISNESEWKIIERDIVLAEKTGCRYHVCHVSTAESVALIREAKKRGIKITAETAPHYLTLCDDMLKEEGRFKMNPPLRSKKDMEALREALLDGTIDVIATDHAPHSFEEKNAGLEKSLMGITGLETAYPVLYTELVKTGIIPYELLVEKLALSPAALIGIKSGIEIGNRADIAIVDNSEEYTIDSKDFTSMGKSTPYNGMKVRGRVKYTIKSGRIIRNI